jgi:NAD(P)-dependent dehydrogenase (short-subunit alcohol dehydrogenase family)
VITGASSGIGRATAIRFAQKGASLVLTARRSELLEDVASECRRFGAETVAVAGDVSDPQFVDNLAKECVLRFGRLDVWVNNAAVTMFSRFEEAPPNVYRRVFETNFFGVVHGARAVLPYFREQGEGVLINMSSVVASAPQPYTSAYVASKYAIRGLSECLRMELALDDAEIHVVHMMPASIDTPLFQHAANFTGRAAKAMEPVYPAELCAATIVRLAEPDIMIDRVRDQRLALGPRDGRGDRHVARHVDGGPDHVEDPVHPEDQRDPRLYVLPQAHGVQDDDEGDDAGAEARHQDNHTDQ